MFLLHWCPKRRGEKSPNNNKTISLLFKFPPAKLIVYHCFLDLIHCRDLGAGRKMGQGHYKSCKPKGILINRYFTCCKSNLQDILIQSACQLGALVHEMHCVKAATFSMAGFYTPQIALLYLFTLNHLGHTRVN